MKTTYDALLEQYLGDVRKYPVISRAEEKKKLEAAGRPATAEAIADALEVNPADVIQMDARLSRSDYSLDERIDEEGHTAIDLLPDDERARPDRMFEEGELRAKQIDEVR